MSFRVVRIQRLLNPHEVVRFEASAHAQRGGSIPLLIGVDHQWDRIAQHLAGELDAPQVDARVGMAYFELDTTHAASQRGLSVSHRLLRGHGQESARGVVATDSVAVSAEQLGQRQTGPLRLEIPQGDVECCDRLHCQAATSD